MRRALALVLLLMAPLTGTLAVEGFDGTDSGDIVGRTPDGGGVPAKALGEWAYAFPSTGLIGIDTNVGVNVFDTDYASYQLQSIPSIPPKHGARLKARVFGTGEPSECPACTLGLESITVDQFTGGDDADITGRSLDGGPGTWYEPVWWPVDYNGFVEIKDGACTNQDGTGGQRATTGITVDGSSCAVRITAHFTLIGDDAPIQGHQFGCYLMSPTIRPGGFTVAQGYGIKMQDHGQLQLMRFRSADALASPPVTGPELSLSENTDYELTLLSYCGWLFGFVDGVLQLSYQLTNEEAADIAGWQPGTIVLSGTNPDHLGEYHTFITRFEVFSAACGSGTPFYEWPGGFLSFGDELVLFEVSLCEDFDNDQAYRLEGKFDAGVVTVELIGFPPGFSRTRLLPTYGPVPWSPSIPIVLQLDYEVSGVDVRILHGYLNGEEILTFDVLNDTPDETGGGLATTMPDLSGTGNPGLSVYDDAIFITDAPRQVVLDEYAVCVAAAAPCVPGGGGGNPGSGGETNAFQWVWEGGVPRAVRTPSPTTSTQNQPWARGTSRPTIRKRVMDEGLWKAIGSSSTFVLDPTLNPDTPCPQDGGLDPLPDPVPIGDKAFGLYNLTKNLVAATPYQYSPFNGAITGASVGSLPALLAAIAARGFQCWFVPAFRNEQTTNNSGRGQYDHPGTMAKFATFSGFTDANLGVIPFAICYDEPLCSPCWLGKPPTQTEVKEGCAAINSYLGVPCAIRMSPRRMLAAGWTPGPSDIRIGMAQFGGVTGFDSEGFGANYAGFIAAQISAAVTLGLDGILWGMNPFRSLVGGWLPEWTDGYLETIGLQAAAAGMNYGVYMWLGYPPSTRVLLPGTNAALQTIAAAL